MTVIEPYVHWNGRVTPTEEARVSVLDTGYLYGDGIYETMRAYGGSAFALDRHLARLRRSGDAIGLRTLNEGDLRVRVTEVMEANGLADAVLRITLTRGQLEKRLDLSTCGEPSVLITAYPIDSAADTARRQGIRVVHSRFLRLTEFSLAGIKTTNYQVSLFARNEAREAGADEVLLANETGDIVEGAASNVFLVTEGELLTPPLGTGILGGITRETVLEIAEREGIPTREKTLPKDLLARADELFLTGTTVQVAPVVCVGDSPVADGRPGSITRSLHDLYMDAVHADTGAASAARSASS